MLTFCPPLTVVPFAFNERLMMQLVGLERTTRGGGKDKVDHPRGAHDDVVNAAAGALVLCRDEVTYSPAQRL
ncbi:MAG: hypothetical protein ACXWCH_34425, partial [Burkholderiales bacterium]